MSEARNAWAAHIMNSKAPTPKRPTKGSSGRRSMALATSGFRTVKVASSTTAMGRRKLANNPKMTHRRAKLQRGEIRQPRRCLRAKNATPTTAASMRKRPATLRMNTVNTHLPPQCLGQVSAPPRPKDIADPGARQPCYPPMVGALLMPRPD